MLIIFSALIFSVSKGIFVGYPLILGFIIFIYISWRRGFPLRDISKMSFNGGKKAFVILKIFLLIGGITSIWMASGTVPAIIFYGMKYLNLNFFVLYVFLISCVISFLLGTSFGTISTVGVAFILMAKSGGLNVSLTAGAILAGAYFGDRCSPMSSSANLVANLTNTNLYVNIRNMLKTSIIPFILSIVIYFMLSLQQKLNFVQGGFTSEITKAFNISWIALLPAIVILVFSLFKFDVKLSMLISIISASAIAIVFQQYNLLEVLNFLVSGFQLDTATPLQSVLKGGGIVSMWKAALVVFISCALSGVFNGTNMLKSIEDILMKANSRPLLLIYTTITSTVTAALGCSQSISIVLTQQLMSKSYERRDINSSQLAVDLENTAVVLSPLIPWNIAAYIPTLTLGVSSSGFIPYAFYLYLIPITNIVYLFISELRTNKPLRSNYTKEV
jgi:NhaC family Na+:H+ antiporter